MKRSGSAKKKKRNTEKAVQVYLDGTRIDLWIKQPFAIPKIRTKRRVKDYIESNPGQKRNSVAPSKKTDPLLTVDNVPSPLKEDDVRNLVDDGLQDFPSPKNTTIEDDGRNKLDHEVDKLLLQQRQNP